MMRKTAVRLLILWLALLGGSACYAQGRFSQATPIGATQFFAALKEVSLDLRSDPSLAKFIPLPEQQADIVKALAGHGIAVRPNAQVTLLVTVTHRAPVIESRSVTTGQLGNSTAVQGIYILTEFFVNAAALRNGKLHLVRAAPAVGWAGSTLAEDSDFRKFLLGDQTGQDTRNRFVEAFGDSLQAIVPNPPPETPWIVNSWTEKATAAADAEYVTLMTPGKPIDKSPLEGLNSTPEIYLTPRFNHDDCKADPGWNDAWTRVFQRLSWTGSQPPRVFLGHFFSCVYAYGFAAPRYFAVSDVIYLQQSDLVFELNGKSVRAWGGLLTTHHEKFALEDTIKEVLADFIPRNIQDFLTDLVLGNGTDAAGSRTTPNPVTPDSHPPGAVPSPLGHGTRNTMFRGKKVVSWSDGIDQRWFYEDGSPVEEAYKLTGTVKGPFFDYRPKAWAKLNQAETDRVAPMMIALHQEVAKYHGGELTEQAQNADLLQSDLPSMTCIVRDYRNDQGTVHFCANLLMLDMARAEVTDSHVLIPCRDEAACVISAGGGGSLATTGAVTLWGKRLSASLSTALSIWTTGRESGQTIVALLTEQANMMAKLAEPTPVVTIP